MKRLVAVFGILGSLSAFAEEAKVEITSFVIAGSRTHAAELCGRVTGATSPVVVKVTVDPNAQKPGIYNALVGTEGTFCTTVVTYEGNAHASIWLLDREFKSALTPVNTNALSR